MNHKISSILLCILLATAMGSATTSAAVRGSPAAQEKRYSRQEPIDTPDYSPTRYTEKRWIGLLKKGHSECPEIAGWRKDLLVDLALGQDQEDVDRKALHKKPLSNKLDRVCVYTNLDASKPFPQPLPPGLAKAERDRMAVTATASPGEIAERSWRILAAHFVDQVGQVRLDRTAAPRVRLVFIDSYPTGEGPPAGPRPGSGHGYTMAHLAHEIVCGGSAPCPVEFATRLVLRYDDYRPDMTLEPPGAESDHGGRLGLVNDLAIAILAEVAHWERAEPGTKLVLNLSVGWDGELGEAGKISDLKARKASKLELSSLAVYEALRYARRRGVLVVAAAGNRRGGRPNTRWPILPAAWELRRPTWLPFGLGRKPIYAVGGVDWQGLPLANSRHRGKPRRAAYADHAVVRTVEPAPTPAPDQEESTMIYTGTSVSAAVASSIAAVLWQLRPELGPAAVRRQMERSADLLDSRADFYAWRALSPVFGPPRIRRLSLCRSVLSACAPDGRRCPDLEAVRCQLWNHPPANLSLIALRERTTSFTSGSPLPPCDSRTRLFSPPAGIPPTAENLCPMELVQDVRNPGLLGPQPEENPCPTCTIVPPPPQRVSLAEAAADPAPGYALLAYIEPYWVGKINSAVLVINCGSEPPRSFNLSTSIVSTYTPPPSRSERILLGTIDGRASLRDCTASVDFNVTVDGQTRSVQSPVYIDP